MSQKFNTPRGGKKARNYGSKGTGMRRHAQSGHSHNPAVTMALSREYNREQERIKAMRKPSKMYTSVKEAFDNERKR